MLLSSATISGNGFSHQNSTHTALGPRQSFRVITPFCFRGFRVQVYTRQAYRRIRLAILYLCSASACQFECSRTVRHDTCYCELGCASACHVFFFACQVRGFVSCRCGFAFDICLLFDQLWGLLLGFSMNSGSIRPVYLFQCLCYALSRLSGEFRGFRRAI